MNVLNGVASTYVFSCNTDKASPGTVNIVGKTSGEENTHTCKNTGVCILISSCFGLTT